MLHELRAGEGREAEVEEVFGPAGLWQLVLRRSEGYVRTELKRVAERVYRVRDIWNSHVEFEAFRKRFAAEVERFFGVLIAEEVLERQVWLGSFYSDEPGDDGTELIPA